ncbi:MAG: hypothetical protein WD271_13000 [Acidimicrobiia bacterium]
MLRTPYRFVVLACTAALCMTLLAGPGAASVPRVQQGINKDSVDVVVLVADLDGLRAQGFNLPAKLTTGNLEKRWEGYFDSYGKINGRSINVTPVTWNPVDPKSFEPACVKATQDNHPFAVLNANGYRASSVGCITVDNGTFMFYGEAVYKGLQQASGKKLVSLGVPAEEAAKTGISIANKQKFFPKTAKIGLLSGNEPAIKAAGDTAESELKKAGYTIAPGGKVEINIVGQDSAAQARDASAAVATMQAAGVDTVIVVVPFTVNSSFFDEANKSGAGFKYMLVDASSSLCTQFGASRVPGPVAAGNVPCVTTWDTRAVAAKNAVKKDNAFEAKCRKVMDATFNETTQPGVPAGDTTDANGQTLTEDLAPNECVMADLFVQALKKAGKNPTTNKLYDAFLTLKSNPAAYMSNGTGGFSKTKPYFANQVHLEILNLANTQTPKDANGLYAGCPAPVTCWVPQLIDGSEWFRVQAST